MNLLSTDVLNQTGAKIQCVPTDKDLVKLLILRLIMKTATQVLMVSTLLNVKVKCDHHSKFSNLSNWKEEA